MSDEILEVHWGPALIQALGKWIVERGQLPQMTSADMATPLMVELSASRRGGEVFQAVRELRTVLDAHAVKVLDLDFVEHLQRLCARAQSQNAETRRNGGGFGGCSAAIFPRPNSVGQWLARRGSEAPWYGFTICFGAGLGTTIFEGAPVSVDYVIAQGFCEWEKNDGTADSADTKQP